MLPAHASNPELSATKLFAELVSRDDDLANGKATLRYKIDSNSEELKTSDKRFTVFLFYGDNFYTNYDSFTGKFSEFPEFVHEYSKGNYKPLLVAYSSDLSDRLFTFLDPINVVQDDPPDEEPNPNNDQVSAQDLYGQINSKIHQEPLLNSKVSFSIKSDNPAMPLSSKPFTVFLFYGDNFYRSYESFTAKFSDFPQEIIHTYEEPGKYRPLLIAYSANLSDRLFTFLDPITVTEFNGTDPVALGHLVGRHDNREANTVLAEFDADGSFDPLSDDALTYLWDFGDGNSIETSSSTIEHTYTNPGTFIPTLKVRTADARESSLYELEAIVISKKIICHDDRDQWFDLGTCRADCGGVEGLQEQFNLCDEERFIPCTSGVCLTEPFTILNEYLEAPGYLSLEADTSNFDDESLLAYRFVVHFPNGDKEQIYKRSSFFIENPGSYQVDLEVYENSYMISKHSETIEMLEANKPPIAVGTVSSTEGEAPLSVTLDASSSSDPEGSALSYEWHFGDGASSTEAVVSHSYQKPGEYRPVLIVTDDRDLSSKTILDMITVEEKNLPPVAKFVKEAKDCNIKQKDGRYFIQLEHRGENNFHCNISFDALMSTDPNRNISEYRWNILDGHDNLIYSGSNPKFTYKFERYDDYLINLSVIDAKGAYDQTDSHLIILEPDPVAVATISNRIDDLDIGSSTISFTAEGSFTYNNEPGSEQITDEPDPDLSYKWQTGDGEEFDGFDLEYTYQVPGTYSPRLIICKYCDDSDDGNNLVTELAMRSIVVDTEKPIVGSVTFSNLTGVEGLESQVSAVTIGNIHKEDWSWIYYAYQKDHDGNTILVNKSDELNNRLQDLHSNILDAPQHFDEAGQYMLVHSLDDKPILSETLTVLPNQIPIPKLTVTHTEGSTDVSVSAEGSYDPKSFDIISYNWDFGDGTETSGITASHTYINDGIYYIKLTVVDAQGLSANAFSKAIIVGDTTHDPGSAPSYDPEPDEEGSEDDALGDDKPNKLLTDDPANDFNTVEDIINPAPNQNQVKLVLGNDQSCKTNACKCTNSFTSGINISSVNFIQPDSRQDHDRGARVAEINGNNFCHHNHTVRVKVDGGSFDERPSSFISENKIQVKLKAKDFKGNNLTIKVIQTAKNGNKHNDELTVSTPNLNSPVKTYTVQDGNSQTISLSNNNNFFIKGNEGQGDGFHCYAGEGPIFIKKEGTLYSQNIRINSKPDTQAKLAIDLNGNRFDGIRVKVNGTNVLTKNPGSGKRFTRVVTEPFDLGTSQDFNLEIRFINPHDLGVMVKKVTIYSSPPPPTASNLDLIKRKNANGKTGFVLKLDSSAHTRIFAAHINRQTKKGQHKDKYKILEVKSADADASGKIDVVFKPTKVKPGLRCIFFYLNNGASSDKDLQDYIRANIISPYNNKLDNNKFAFINQSEMDHLQNTALPINHGICFNDDLQTNIEIIEPSSNFEIQANNQDYAIKLSTGAPAHVKAGWEYNVRLCPEASCTSDTEVPLTVRKLSEEEDFTQEHEGFIFEVSPDLIGGWNLAIRLEYFDTVLKKTYVGETYKQIKILEDLDPIAKVVTLDTEKLILEASDDPNQRADFSGAYSFDPNKAIFESVEDGISSYSWTTQFKALDASPDDAFNTISSLHVANADVYAIGPRKEPGIYRAILKVFDFFNKDDSANSDSVQIIRPGQQLAASLSVKDHDKIYQPDDFGNAEIRFEANVKVIGVDKPTSLGYKFIYGDDSEETGTLDPNSIELNRFINIPELKDRAHIYVEGEYEPSLEVWASFPDGHDEKWTVSAGTVTIAQLPTHVAFTPYIANLGPKEIANPGFNAQLKVSSKQIFNTTVTGFGWDYGDGTEWTYGGNNPNADFISSSVTDKEHTYPDEGVYEIKFWVSTSDDPEPIVFALKPLEVKDAPIPVIETLSINKQVENVKINDEELIEIEAFINTNVDIDRADLIIRHKGDNTVVYSETFTDDIDSSFAKTLKNVYLEPGEYFLDMIISDEYERDASKTLGFEVKKTKQLNRSVDFSELNKFAKKAKSYSYDTTHQLPIQIRKRVQSITVYNNDKKHRTFINVLDDFSRFNELTEEEIPEDEDDYSDADLTVELFDGDNALNIEVLLPNGKLIQSKTYNIEVDYTKPTIEIETPVNYSQYRSNNLILSGNIYDDHLSKAYFRINNSGFKLLSFEKEADEIDLWTYEKEIDLSNYDLFEDNINTIEILAEDRAGNQSFEHGSFSHSDHLPQSEFSNTIDVDFLNRPDPVPPPINESGDGPLHGPDFECTSIFDVTNNVVFTDGSYPRAIPDPSTNERRFIYIIPQGRPFNIAFNTAVCDDNKKGPANTTFSFTLSPNLKFTSLNNQTIERSQAFDTLNLGTVLNTDVYSNPGSVSNLYVGHLRNVEGDGDLDSSFDFPNTIFTYYFFEGLNQFNDERLDIGAGNMKNIWSQGRYRYAINPKWNNQSFITGTNARFDSYVKVDIVEGDKGDSVKVLPNNQVIEPDVLFANHNVDHIGLNVKVESVTPIEASALRVFQLKRDVYKTRLTPEDHNLRINRMSPVGIKDELGNYIALFRVQADNLPQLLGGHEGQRIRIDYINEQDGNFLLSRGSLLLNVQKAPDKFVFVKIEEDFSNNNLSEEQIEKEEGFVSNRPKKFKMTVHHINDGGLTPQEIAGSTSTILNNLTITQYDYMGEASELNGDKLSFNLTENSGDSNKYPGYWKSTYISSGPDAGGTIFKDEVSLDFKIDLSEFLDTQEANGFTFDNDPDRKSETSSYKIDPIPVEINNLSLSVDQLLFEPDEDNIEASSSNLNYQSNPFTFQGDFEYEESLSTDFRSLKFNFKKNPDEKKAKLGLKLLRRNSSNAFIELNGIGLTDALDIQDFGEESSLSFPLSLTLNANEKTLLRKQEAVDLRKSHTLIVPFSVVVKSETDLDIQLRGVYEANTKAESDDDLETDDTVVEEDPNDQIQVKFMDSPRFDDDSTVAKLKGKQSRRKDRDLFLHTKIFNTVGKKFDPLEMELELLDEFGGHLESFVVNNSTLHRNKTISPIRSKGYKSSKNVSPSDRIHKTNLTKLAPDSFKENLILADKVAVKLRRDRSYVESLVDASEVDSYYTVSEGDPFRYRVFDIDHGLRNYCKILASGIPVQSPHIISDESELNNIEIEFTANHKKKAKVWIIDAEKNEHKFIGDNIYSTSNFNTGNVNPAKHTVQPSEGVFNFSNFTAPERARYDINFVVGAGNADPNVIASGLGDANTGVVCGIHVLKDIAEADIIIEGLQPTIINQISRGRSHEVWVKTDPAESIDGIKLGLRYAPDPSNPENLRFKLIDPIRSGAYLYFDIKDEAPTTETGIKYTLIAELTYNDATAENGLSVKDETREFEFVEDTEPIISFGSNNNDFGDPHSSGESNVLIGIPGQSYDLSTKTISFEGLENMNDISFNLVDRIEPSESVTNVPYSHNIDTSGNIQVNLLHSLPFNVFDDIKEYTLQVYRSGQLLSQKVNFLIVDDPIVTIDSESLLEFGETNEANLEMVASVDNGFDRDLKIQVATFVGGDPNNGTDKLYESDGVHDTTHSVDQRFRREADAGGRSFLAQALPAAIPLIGTPLGIFLIAAIAVYSGVQLNKLIKKISASKREVIETQSEIRAQKSVAYGDFVRLFDIELLDLHGNTKKFFDGDSGFKLKVRSSGPGRVIVKQRNNDQANSRVIMDYEYTDTDQEDGLYSFPIPGGSESKQKNSFATVVDINPPDTIDGHIGITSIDLVYEDEDGNLLIFAGAIILIRAAATQVSGSCLIQEVMSQGSGINTTEEAIEAIAEFIIHARITSLLTSIIGIFTTDGHYLVHAGDIVKDMVRILLKAKQGNVEGLGYCESLANHVVERNKRPGLMRVFESKNHMNGPESEAQENYIVYWLSKGSNKFGLRHILSDHGFKSNKNKGKFNSDDNIVNLIQRAIINSSKSDRTISIDGKQRTVFDRKGLGIWILNNPPRTVLRVIGGSDIENNNERKNAIISAFPER